MIKLIKLIFNPANMIVVGAVLLAWTAACWFSEPFKQSLFFLTIFDVHPLLAFAITLCWFLATIILWLRRSGLEVWREGIRRLGANGKIVVSLSVILALHLALQLPAIIMYRGANDTDSAFYGLEGFHIAEGKERPLFCYGLHYTGTLIPHMAALLQILFGKSAVYIRIINSLFYLGFIVVLYALAQRLIGRGAALLAVCLAAIPPYYVFAQLKYTEFPEILFWGTLSLFILSYILQEERMSRRLYFWYGIVVGVGFYAQPQTIYFIGAGLMALFIRDKLFFIRPSFLVVPIGFFVGSIGTFIDSFYYDWIIFRHFLGTQAIDFGILERIKTGFTEFLKHLPGFLGLKGDIETRALFDPWVFWAACAIFGICFIFYLYKNRKRILETLKFKNVDLGSLIFLALGLSVLVIFTLSGRLNYHTPMRYVFPVWVAVPVCIAVGCFSIKQISKTAAVIVAAIFIVLFLWSNILQQQHIYEREIIMQRWEAFCREHNISRFYGKYYRTIWMNYITLEKIIGSNEYHWFYTPYRPYVDIVGSSEEVPAFLFDGEYRALQDKFENMLMSLGVRYRKTESPLGTVFHEFNKRITPKQLYNLKPGSYQAKFHGIKAGKITGLPEGVSLWILDLDLQNTGKVDWRCSGADGFIELVVRSAHGRELRRQPLINDVASAEMVNWRVLLDAEEVGDRAFEVCVEVNNIVISSEGCPLKPALNQFEEVEKVPLNHVLATGFYSKELLDEEYIFVSGWGVSAPGKSSAIRLSGGEESTIGFVLGEQKSTTISMLLGPIRDQEVFFDQQQVSFFVNGSEQINTVDLPRQKRIFLNIPARYLHPGLNFLTIIYLNIEPEFRTAKGAIVYRIRPRAIVLSSISFL
jgi:hypothetical protein